MTLPIGSQGVVIARLERRVRLLMLWVIVTSLIAIGALIWTPPNLNLDSLRVKDLIITDYRGDLRGRWHMNKTNNNSLEMYTEDWCGHILTGLWEDFSGLGANGSSLTLFSPGGRTLINMSATSLVNTGAFLRARADTVGVVISANVGNSESLPRSGIQVYGSDTFGNQISNWQSPDGYSVQAIQKKELMRRERLPSWLDETYVPQEDTYSSKAHPEVSSK